MMLMEIVLWSTGKAIWAHGIKWGGKTLLELDYADDLSIPDEKYEQNEWAYRGYKSSEC